MRSAKTPEMIEILPAPDHVVALRIAGTIGGEDVDRVVQMIEARLKSHPKLGVYVDIVELDDITADAASKDLRYGLAMIGEWHRFPREAVVTNKQWVRALASLAARLVPQVEVRAFAPDEREQALAWASAVTA
jgi:hypothetical protein